MTAASMRKCLSLSAEDEEDFAVISALLQDAEVKVQDMTFLRDEHKFVVLVKRLVKETKQATDPRRATRNTVQTGLCFDGVRSVRTRDIVRKDRNSLLRFLVVSYVHEEIALIFSEGEAIKLEGDKMVCLFRDLDTNSDVDENSA